MKYQFPNQNMRKALQLQRLTTFKPDGIHHVFMLLFYYEYRISICYSFPLQNILDEHLCSIYLSTIKYFMPVCVSIVCSDYSKGVVSIHSGGVRKADSAPAEGIQRTCRRGLPLPGPCRRPLSFGLVYVIFEITNSCINGPEGRISFRKFSEQAA